MKQEELEQNLKDITSSRFIAEIAKRIETSGLDAIESDLIEKEDGTYQGTVEISYQLQFSKENVEHIRNLKKDTEVSE